MNFNWSTTYSPDIPSWLNRIKISNFKGFDRRTLDLQFLFISFAPAVEDNFIIIGLGERLEGEGVR